jgi:hypothetical protein
MGRYVFPDGELISRVGVPPCSRTVSRCVMSRASAALRATLEPGWPGGRPDRAVELVGRPGPASGASTWPARGLLRDGLIGINQVLRSSPTAVAPGSACARSGGRAARPAADTPTGGHRPPLRRYLACSTGQE